MPTLTLDGLSDEALRRLHERARSEQRTPAEEAAVLLEAALAPDAGQPSFSDAVAHYLETRGLSPFDEDAFEATFAGLRSREVGRASEADLLRDA